MPIKRREYLLAVLISIACPLAPAGADPLVTDRPDFTESTLAIRPGRAQLEMGLTWTRDERGGDTTSFEAPEALLRLGLRAGLELRVGAPSYAWQDNAGIEENGVTDMELGFKLELAKQSGGRPSLAVLGGLSLPSGEDPFTSDELDPTLLLAWAYDIGESGWSIAGNAGVASLNDPAADRFEEFSTSLAVGIPLTDMLGAYTEYYGFYRSGAGEGPEHYLNAGLTYLLSDDIQLDIRVGTGLNERADDLFVGAGVSLRF